MFSSPNIDNWWNNVLGNPKYVVAPMVDASELPWRILSRNYKAQLCFTPMIHSKNFVNDIKYRKENTPSVLSNDRPLIVQFCGNDPSILVEAARLVKEFCDGVDINLGCPQTIAKRGQYGAFLQNDWELLTTIVRRLTTEVNIPISCKIRVFEDIDKTVKYAKMLESAGAWMLTVHGRTIEQKGMQTGIASWKHIKEVKKEVRVPVLANGNIQYLEDVHRCLDFTGVDGVMSAEGNLHDPGIFTGEQQPVWNYGLEYLNLAKTYKCPLSSSRGHLFKLYHHLLSLDENEDLRCLLGRGNDLSEFEHVTLQLKERFEPYHLGKKIWTPPTSNDDNTDINLPFPVWICQPYVRQPTSSNSKQINESNSNKDTNVINDSKVEISSSKRKQLSPETNVENPVSKKFLKKLAKYPPGHKIFTPKIARIAMELCNSCINPGSAKCDFKSCRSCCQNKCYLEDLECHGHKFLPKSRYFKLKEKERNGARVLENSLITISREEV